MKVYGVSPWGSVVLATMVRQYTVGPSSMIDLEDCKIWDGNRKIVLPRLTVNRGFYKIVKATPKAKAAVQQIVDAQRHVSALVAKL